MNDGTANDAGLLHSEDMFTKIGDTGPISPANRRSVDEFRVATIGLRRHPRAS